ncbi:hypothetical protein JTP68_11575 [Dietzia cinnamea]|uniref:hypothetical protein n=1 Tax=Dietzia cinnamea TaxID=321318 RepID=UPI00195C7F03|nr:hypothetical protein [Dietzia cinnamea]
MKPGEVAVSEAVHCTKFALMDPFSDQALAVARNLRNSAGDIEVYAALETKASVFEKLILRISYGRADCLKELASEGCVVIPTTYKATETVFSSANTEMTLPRISSQMMDVADKIAMLQRARELGVPIPGQFSISELKNENGSIPFFYKEKREQGGGRRGLAWSVADLPGDTTGLLLEEFIDTPGTYGVAFYASDGKIVEHTCHLEALSKPAAGGSAVLLKSISSPRLVELTSRLVESLAYTGWGLAEFKWSDRKNDYVFMEINGKLWASCAFSFAVNPRLFEVAFDRHLKKRQKPPQRGFYPLRARTFPSWLVGVGLVASRRGVWYVHPLRLALSISAMLRRATALPRAR